MHYRQDNESSSINSPGKVYCICDEYDEMERFLQERPIERGVVEPIMIRIKYDSYNWNYSRLSEKLQEEFIIRFYKDFARHRTEGLLQKDYFEWYKWNNLHKILRNPLKYHQNKLDEKAGRKPKNKPAPGKPYQPKASQDGRKDGLLNKTIGGLQCIKDHGFGYTVKYAFRKNSRRSGK